jgi:hypothetical protein
VAAVSFSSETKQADRSLKLLSLKQSSIRIQECNRDMYPEVGLKSQEHQIIRLDICQPEPLTKLRLV